MQNRKRISATESHTFELKQQQALFLFRFIFYSMKLWKIFVVLEIIGNIDFVAVA